MSEEQESELASLIKACATRYGAPPSLRGGLMTALRQADSRQALATRGPLRMPWQPWAGMGFAFACGVLATWALTWFLAAQVTVNRFSDEVVADHVRSLMAAHLTDVASSDQHTVKPWFSGKLDFSPPVKDLVSNGFPLMGGRLDYLDQRTVAVLVYRHRQHTINLFIWPSTNNSMSGLKLLSRRGFNMVDWYDYGMQYWAVSDLNSAELQTFAKLVREGADKAPG
jgi:anti-sigma factor RsiW